VGEALRPDPLPHFAFMTFEHFALNVPDARAHARWYVDHLGFTVARRRDDAPFTHFLADDSGLVIIELYTNPAAPIPDYAAAPPLCFHFAVISRDAAADRARLETAGATFAVEDLLPDGSRLIMLRDPWGVPLQLCQRATPLPSPAS
jgi:Glyoxalase/Bleomycin resistance protein/Dioxygenase superfamily.